MQLLDRYLEAMRFWLPESEQDDILHELAENIRAQVEDKEAELGRPLTIDEESAILKQHGHPMLFGVRYGRGLKYLIGPVMYPFYKLVLKISLVIIAVGHVINAVVLAYTKHPVGEVITSFFGFFHAIFPMLGWMTLVFAVLDRCVEKYKLLDRWVADWDPATLPDVQLKKVKPESLWKRLLGVCAESALSIWWLVGLRKPFLIIGPAASLITFGPVFYKLYPVFVVLAIASIAFKWITLLRPVTRTIRWAQLAFKAAGLAITLVLVRAGNLIVLANPTNPQPNATGVVTVVQTAAQIGLTIALTIGVIQLGWDCFKLLRGKPNDPAGVTSCA
jgi:hypothetical protein